MKNYAANYIIFKKHTINLHFPLKKQVRIYNCKINFFFLSKTFSIKREKYWKSAIFQFYTSYALSLVRTNQYSKIHVAYRSVEHTHTHTHTYMLHLHNLRNACSNRWKRLSANRDFSRLGNFEMLVLFSKLRANEWILVWGTIATSIGKNRGKWVNTWRVTN